MTTQVETLVAQLRQQRSASTFEPVICIYDQLIAALLELQTNEGTGTVTSVGLALDTGLYTVSGSPVIAAGTLTGTLNTQAANLIFAGPTTGAAAKPTFRAAVAADIAGLSPSFAGLDITSGGRITWGGGVSNSIQGDSGAGTMIYNAATSHALKIAGAAVLTAIAGGVTVAQPLTYGGTAFNNTATGASGGSLVGSNAPTVANLTNTGTLTAGAANFSGVIAQTINQDNTTSVSVSNNDGGGSALANYVASNGTYNTQIGQLGTGYSSSGALSTNSGFVYSNGVGGVAIVAAAGPVKFAPNGVTEAGRFGTDGSFLVGTTTNGGWPGGAKMEVRNNTDTFSAYNTGSAGAAIIARIDNTAANLELFSYNGSTVGTITTNGTLTAYNTTSGRDIKDNIAPLDSAFALDMLKASRPASFTFKATGAQGHGFVVEDSHEAGLAIGVDMEQLGLVRLKSGVPAIVPHKTEAGLSTIRYQPANRAGADYGKWTPYAIAVILAQQATIENLTGRIAALEAN